ncbi:hypothetical protein [Anianabacter salinae]|uniref:hypothetical protein n=1 Tax=Anianabacter salinae TaxID=2851023 RepID=UPI00225DE3C1|nr:hypothetical protein [Anianabacter salinae]MBV0911747.1 hypothetical protein [Anianabacter salinae]
MASGSHVQFEKRLHGLVGSALRRFPTSVYEIVNNARKVWIREGNLLVPKVHIKFENREIPFCISFVSARIAVAIMYKSAGLVLKTGTRMRVRWQTNIQPFDEIFFERFLRTLPDYVSLSQGAWKQSDQFESRFLVDEIKHAGVFALNFHRTVQAIVIVNFEEDDFEGDEAWLTFQVDGEGLTPVGGSFPPDIWVSPREKK